MVAPWIPELIAPADLQPDRIKMFVFGDFGQGKSTFAATAPRCLYLSIEGGEIALAKMPSTHQVDPRSRVVRITSVDHLRQAFWFILTNQYGFGEYETIVVDSLSDLQSQILFQTMSEEEAKKPNRPKGVPQRDDYMKTTNTMQRMAMQFRNLPRHVIFTAQYKNDKSPDTVGGYTGSRPIRGDLQPATYKAVAGYVDLMAYLQAFDEQDAYGRPTGGKKRYMFFNSVTYAVKSRFLQLPDWLENPTFPQIIDLIQRG